MLFCRRPPKKESQSAMEPLLLAILLGIIFLVGVIVIRRVVFGRPSERSRPRGVGDSPPANPLGPGRGIRGDGYGRVDVGGPSAAVSLDRRPYRLREDFLTAAERNFYLVLHDAVQGTAFICPKVSLGDLFYAQTGDHRENRLYLNRIDRKHVDFLLCDPRTVRPLAGIELDDRSHRQPDRQDRDILVQEVFDAAHLPLIRVPVGSAYSCVELRERLWREAGIGTRLPTVAPR